MKRGFKTFLLICSIVILTTGCGNKSVVKTCNLTATDNNLGYKLTSVYKIYGTNDTVDKVVTQEVIESENKEILDLMEQSVKSTYETNNNTYGGYEFNVTNENNKVTSDVTIDYSKMDLDKFVSDNSVLKQYVDKNNKLLITGVESLYKSLGAVCEDE